SRVDGNNGPHMPGVGAMPGSEPEGLGASPQWGQADHQQWQPDHPQDGQMGTQPQLGQSFQGLPPQMQQWIEQYQKSIGLPQQPGQQRPYGFPGFMARGGRSDQGGARGEDGGHSVPINAAGGEFVI